MGLVVYAAKRYSFRAPGSNLRQVKTWHTPNMSSMHSLGIGHELVEVWDKDVPCQSSSQKSVKVASSASSATTLICNIRSGGLHWAKYCPLPASSIATTVPQLRTLFDFLHNHNRQVTSENNAKWEVRGNWSDSGTAKIVQFIRGDTEIEQTLEIDKTQAAAQKKTTAKAEAAAAAEGAGVGVGPGEGVGNQSSHLNLSSRFLPSWKSSGKTPIGPFLLISSNMIQGSKAWVWACGTEAEVQQMRQSLPCLPDSAIHALPFQWAHSISLELCFSLLSHICADEEGASARSAAQQLQQQQQQGGGCDSGRPGSGGSDDSGGGCGCGGGGSGGGSGRPFSGCSDPAVRPHDVQQQQQHQQQLTQGMEESTKWTWPSLLARCREDAALRVASLFRTQPAMLQSPLAVIETDIRLCKESFPWAYRDDQPSGSGSGSEGEGGEASAPARTVLAACVQNGSNAFFCCKVGDVQVSAAHAIPAVMRLSREANWPRIRILLVAQRDGDNDKDKGGGNGGNGGDNGNGDGDGMDCGDNERHSMLPSLPSAILRRVFSFLVIHSANFPQ